MSVEIENEASFLAACRNGINLFVGAGFSVLARDYKGRGLPVGPMLGNELREEFSVDLAGSLTLAQLYTIIESRNSEALHSYVRSRFTVVAYDPLYLSLENVAVKSFFTTNVDNLIQRIYERSLHFYLSDLDFQGSAPFDREAIELAMLHGSVLSDARPLRFGTLDISSSFSADQDRWSSFRAKLNARPTLFWGYALQDAGTLQAIKSAAPGRATDGDSWIQLLPSDKGSSLAEYLEALNFQVIYADTAGLLTYLSENIQAPTATDARLNALLLENIPHPTSVPSRPFEDFHRGAAPSWSDIFSGNLYKTSHYRDITNSLNAGNNVIVTGIPASGKTTLLMQIAAEFAFDGPKLIEDGITKQRAELLVRQLGGQRALVIVDNLVSDVDGVALLGKAPGVQLIAADRDYALSTITHRLNMSTLDTRSITELTERDLNSLRAAIPSSIRTRLYNYPEMQGRTRPSLYEFVQANVKETSVATRLGDAIRTLRSEDPDLAETLIFVCYVHSCRTPVSMDMLLAQFRDRIEDYREAYAMMNRAGALLSDYEGDLAKEAQDYFAARSMSVSEAILRFAPGSLVREMLSTFHRNISPVRIPAYKTFRRRAYDAQLFLRAFPVTEEALDIYDSVYEREENAYILQQKATFLAERDRVNEAFRTIDDARSQVRGQRNWRIENTHAKIMFEANLDLARSDDAVRHLLDRSLGRLSECFENDRRKGMHALVFGDFSMRYWRAFRDDLAAAYLREAVDMLKTVRRTEPWLNRAEVLLRAVEELLRAAE